MPLSKLTKSQLSKIKDVKKGSCTTRNDAKKQIKLPNIYDLKHILAHNQMNEEMRQKDFETQARNNLKRKLNLMRQIISPKKVEKTDINDQKLQGECTAFILDRYSCKYS